VLLFNRTKEQSMQNLFIGKGNLAASPDGKWVDRAGGTDKFFVASMRVMFGRYARTGDGGVEQVGGFWREVEIFGQKGQDCVAHLRKGARVLVIGEEREFTAHDDDGNEVQVMKVVAEDVALQLTRIESIKFAPARPREEEVEA
jgi:single-strand DNA-binding protein